MQVVWKINTWSDGLATWLAAKALTSLAPRTSLSVVTNLLALAENSLGTVFPAVSSLVDRSASNTDV